MTRFFGFGANTGELGIELRIGVGADACDLGLELARGRFLRHHPGFLCGEFAERFGFELRLRLGQAGFCGFLAEALEVRAQSRFGFLAHACHFGLERAGGSLVRSSPRVLRRLVAAFVGLALRVLLRPLSLLGFDAQTFELGAQPRVSLGLHARDLGFDCACG